MIRAVMGTMGTRVVVTLLNLLVVMAAGRLLGAQGLGTISLLILGTALILLVNNVVSGGGAVYLTPRYGAEALRLPGYAWTLATGITSFFVLDATGLVPAPWHTAVAIIATLQGGINLHLGIILGRQRIATHNAILILQAALQTGLFLHFLHQGHATVMDHVHASYLSNGVVLLLSGYLSMGPAPAPALPVERPYGAMFRQGSSAQAANALQLLNYRYAFFLLERWVGLAGLGIYSVGIQLAEGGWMLPKSIGMVLYARVSNATDARLERELTLAAVKVSVLATAVFTGTLLVLPDVVYQWLFGPEIHGLHGLLWSLLPGLLAMAASQALSHFLSGAGQVRRNAIGSGIGAVITLIVATWAVPRWGLHGAAWTASLAYCASVIYQWWSFHVLTGARCRELLPTTADRHAMVLLLKKLTGA
jgi:O-antigen/teichoic acid export membrane protein